MSSSAGRPPARSNHLVSLGSAAVLTVYAAGFARTNAAAQRLEEGSDARRRPPSAEPAPAPSDPAYRAVAPGAAITPAARTSATAPTAAVTGAALAPSAAVGNAAPAASGAAVPPVAPVTAKSASAGPAGAASAPSGADAAPVATSSAVSSPVSAPAAPAPALSQPTVAPVATAAPVTAPAPAAPAPAPTPTPTASHAPAADSAKAPAAKSVGWHDGTYTGWGTSRHGDIEATVVVENGKITGAIISRCLTRYSCSWVAHLQAQVVARQSPDVDNVSGATQSANAFYYAVIEALAKAK